MGALGVAVCGLDWIDQAALFGVIEAILGPLDRGVASRAARHDGAPQETQHGAHPPGVEGEPERKETVTMMSSDREPDRRHHAAHRCQKETYIHYIFIYIVYNRKHQASISGTVCNLFRNKRTYCLDI